jgi:hypothetical protein
VPGQSVRVTLMDAPKAHVCELSGSPQECRKGYESPGRQAVSSVWANDVAAPPERPRLRRIEPNSAERIECAPWAYITAMAIGTAMRRGSWWRRVRVYRSVSIPYHVVRYSHYLTLLTVARARAPHTAPTDSVERSGS